ncbi:Transposon Tf2-1 polyprotein [Ceratobasidium sp. AG-Ba]|nr:Transposon Tf2-1 polyprotein [Ceratobasidium sp. AG-Ba]
MDKSKNTNTRGKALTGRGNTAPTTDPSSQVASGLGTSTMPGTMNLTGDFSEESPFNTTTSGTGNLGPEQESTGLFRSAGIGTEDADTRKNSESLDTRMYATPSDASKTDTQKISLDHIPGQTGEATRILRGMAKVLDDESATPSAKALRRERRKAQSWPDGLEGELASESTAGPSKPTEGPKDKGKLKEVPKESAESGDEKSSDGNFTETFATPRKSALKLSKEKKKVEINWDSQAIADWHMLKQIIDDPMRLKGVEAYNMSKTVELAKELTGKAEKKDEPKKKKKARVSLGVNIDDLEGKKKKGTQGLPTGGYLAEKLRDEEGENSGANAPGDPDDDSSSSSDDSSGSDDNYRNMTPQERDAYKKGKRDRERSKRKKQRKLEKLKLSGYKTKLPTPYNGKSNYDIYEQFVYEVDTWVQDTGFSDREAIQHIKGFLKDKAATFYMNHVAPNPRKYTMTELWSELFEYCFPPDVKARQRKKFYQTHQSERGFRDFVRELRKYQKRVSDISEEQVAQRVWDGALPYPRVEWAKAGMNAEDNTVEELEETGVRFEVAECIRRSEENRRKEKDRNTSRPDNRREWRPRDDGQGSDSHKKDHRPRPGPSGSNTSGPSNYYNKRTSPGLPSLQKNRWTNIKQKEDVSYAPNSSINFAQLERMYDAHKNIEVNNIDIDYSTCKKDTEGEALELNAIKKQKPKQITEIEQNSATPKDIERRIIPAIVVDVSVNGHPAQALLDSGSLGDFVSTTLVDQLKLPKAELAKPMGLSMAVAGSKGIIKYGVNARIGYQEIDEGHHLDVVNLERYDLILGTPFMFKHGVSISFNPNGVHVRYPKAQPIKGKAAKVISSCATEIVEENLEKLRELLRKESKDVCKKASETPLPPLRVINHRIPMIDDNKTYSWRSSRCPDALRGQWEEKLNAYINSGRWEYATGKNAIPMLLIPKKGSGACHYKQY